MTDLIQTLISSDVSGLRDLLGYMFEPALACIVVLMVAIPAAGLIECLCLLVRILAGGGRNA